MLYWRLTTTDLIYEGLVVAVRDLTDLATLRLDLLFALHQINLERVLLRITFCSVDDNRRWFGLFKFLLLVEVPSGKLNTQDLPFV
jgi:hypothetical protein